jgi:hypothetical protein
MKRADVEAAIEAATGVSSSYPAQDPTASPPEAWYTDGATTLFVTYIPGAPAPRFQDADGQIVHGPPTDQTVVSWRWIRDPIDGGGR